MQFQNTILPGIDRVPLDLHPHGIAPTWEVFFLALVGGL